MVDVISHQRAKRLANEHLRAEGSPWVATHATRDSPYGVWIIGYGDPTEPDMMLVGGGLVVTDVGGVHRLSSAPGSLDDLMMDLGRVASVLEREGESLALLADTDPEEAAGLAAWAAARRPWPGILDEERAKPYSATSCGSSTASGPVRRCTPRKATCSLHST